LVIGHSSFGKDKGSGTEDKGQFQNKSLIPVIYRQPLVQIESGSVLGSQKKLNGLNLAE
jgi:hypothetical protein